MRFAEPSCEEIKITNPLKKIEVCGRICYKSEEKINNNSSVKFVQMLRDRKHTAMLEHVQFHIIMSHAYATRLYNLPLEDPNVHNTLIVDTLDYKEALVTGNVVTLRNLLRSIKRNIENSDPYIALIARSIWAEDEWAYNTLFSDVVRIMDVPETSHSRCVTDDYIWHNLTRDVAQRHIHLTYKFICDRGVSHELVRHRPVSFAQESTRYCNYSQNKFGNELTFIEPFFFEGDKLDMWTHAMINAETSYMELIEHGVSPQEARDVLPNSIKTEIIMTAPIVEWLHIFDLRCDKAAHPQMREVMDKCLKLYLSGYGNRDIIASGIL